MDGHISNSTAFGSQNQSSPHKSTCWNEAHAGTWLPLLLARQQNWNAATWSLLSSELATHPVVLTAEYPEHPEPPPSLLYDGRVTEKHMDCPFPVENYSQHSSWSRFPPGKWQGSPCPFSMPTSLTMLALSLPCCTHCRMARESRTSTSPQTAGKDMDCTFSRGYFDQPLGWE